MLKKTIKPRIYSGALLTAEYLDRWNLEEDHDPDEQHERLDEREPENERELNAGTGGRVAGETFAGGGSDLALSEGGAGDGDAEADCGECPASNSGVPGIGRSGGACAPFKTSR